MKSIAIMLSALLFLLVFSFKSSDDCQQYHPSRGEQMINTILENAAKELQDRYKIHSCGSGVAMPGGPIREVTLCFQTKYAYSKDELRELLIQLNSDLLNKIVENKEIQQYLKYKPFKVRNIEIIIYNGGKEGVELVDPNISVARLSVGRLLFRTIDPEDSFKYKSRCFESYEEALDIIKKTNKSQSD